MMIRVADYPKVTELEDVSVGWFATHIPTRLRDSFARTSCIDVRIDGLREDGSLADGMQALWSLAWSFFKAVGLNCYLVRVSSDLSPKSRVKLHKGLFDIFGTIRRGAFAETEIEQSNQSLLCGIALVDDLNKDECFSIALDVFRSFLFVSPLQKFEAVGELVFRDIAHCLNINSMGSIVIDKVNVISKFVDSPAIVCGFRSDPNKDYVNLPLFMAASDRLERLSILREIATPNRSI